MKLESLKDGVGELWESMTDGWRHLREHAAGALTRFRASERTGLPLRQAVDDLAYFPVQGWSMLGGEVFEDAGRIIVRVELPGMRKEDIQVDVLDAAVVISGEKRFLHEEGEGRWRVLQCAYGQFERRVPLKSPVDAGQAHAAYRDGVLRIEVPKLQRASPRSVSINID